MTGQVLLEVRHLSKTYPGQRALDRVSLAVHAGEVHALLGQNGSGKSTLIKALSGYHTPDPGSEIWMHGLPYDPVGAADRRLGFVHQELGLVPTLDVVDNLALGRGFRCHRSGRIDWPEERRAARDLISRFCEPFELSTPVGELSYAQQAVVAMARALDGAGGESVLVLDEPTASLPVVEVRRLFTSIRRFVGQGGGVLFVSHRLDEVLEIADHVSVLRDGRLVASRSMRDLDERRLVEMIVGRSVESVNTADRAPLGRAVLEVRDLEGERVAGVDITVHAGEIVGVTGLLGSGREELAGLIFGDDRPSGGSVAVDGVKMRHVGPAYSVAAGLALVPADRAHKGIIPTESVSSNIVLPELGSLLRAGRLDQRRELREARSWIEKLEVRPPDVERQVRSLSGGNQQKVVLAKWLRTNPKVLIADEPTQGVDVGAKASIHQLLVDAASDGLGILVCTAETEDLPSLCDRVIVLRGGVVVAELAGEELDEHRLIAASLGTAAGSGSMMAAVG